MKEKMSGFLFSLTVNLLTAASITINLFLVKEEIKKDCKNKKTHPIWDGCRKQH